MWAGANDVFAGAVVEPAADLAGQIERLRAAGARFILVPNVPDLGLTPNAIASGTTAARTAASAQFNQTLYSALAARGLRVIAMDTFTLLREVTADPGRYGFVDVTSRACGSDPAILCGPGDLVAPGADQNFLFADDRHPTGGGHELLADYASSILAAPAQISMLAEAAVATRSAQIDRLFLRLAEPPRGRGLWVSLDGRRVSVESGGIASDAEGSGGGLTVGADLLRGSRWLVGAALGIGRVKPEFGNGGHFTQDEAVVSLYGGWANGPWHAGAVLSYGVLDHQVNRDIRLRTATRTASASPGGSNVSLGLEAGYRFSTARLTHGPIAGVLLQRARIDAFTEEGGGAAGLRYGEQRRDAVIGRLGWMLAYDAGRWQPYARVSVERELRDAEREIEAQLVTAPELPMFPMPAIAAERNRLTLAAGTAVLLGETWAANIGALHSEASGDGTSAVFLTLSAKF